ncbi:metal ABC transporter solute-binding protein, Zn/Mn family [Desulfurivibrio dismutans]|uniref:metal ABC transporter solute-binding protein, Zn/Mn family n=1 Tax=Desulfurivibrio dismutans TaxID=1398908 RepID=UPI0023DCC8E3|nr:zinc ABC transporter substrate-binding protein [Desulfurivibrio alkaliphilus]MDF1614945.1 zinc ABC transporter substrate-binding protein [Desulfurivibrio alkaliphilus]
MDNMICLLPKRLLSLLLGCGALLFGPITLPAAELQVVTGIAPLSFLVSEIGGERVRVGTLIPPGQDPHTFEPRPGQVTELGQADLYFALDMPFERTLLARLPRRGASGPRIIDVTRGIDKLPMPEHHHHDDHDDHHGESKSHNRHGELDPHIWLGPEQLLTVIEHIRDGLVTADPDHASIYREKHNRLRRTIEEVHARNREKLAPLAGQTFFVYHPAFGYFAAAYDLRQTTVEISGKSPTPRQLIALIEAARQAGVRIIFVQPQFDQRSAVAVARAIDGRVVALDPLAADLLTNLEQMATTIKTALTNDGDQ